jgi:o-succinylbenzoate synthase
MDWSITSVSLPLASPLETARGPIEARSGWLVSVSSADEQGIGEATPLAGWTESHEHCEHALERAIAALTEATAPEDCQQIIDDIDAPAARHGCQLALADLRARQADEPLYRWLGAEQTVDRVPVNATVGDAGTEATVERVREAIDAGFDCVKLKIGARQPVSDAKRLRAVREQIDADLTLRADANGAWDRATAQAALEWLAETDVTYVEQPLAADGLDGHAELRGRGVGIALDESLASFDVERILDAEAADVLICKPMVLGGIDRALDIALTAREHDVEPIITTTIDGAVARAGARHLGAVLQPAPAFGLATGSLLAEDLVDDPTRLQAGTVAVAQTPGHGVVPRD